MVNRPSGANRLLARGAGFLGSVGRQLGWVKSGDSEVPAWLQGGDAGGKTPPALRRLSQHSRDVAVVLPECAAVVVCLALVWLSLLAPLNQERHAAERSAYEATGNLARAFDENTERVVSGIDQILLTARAAYRENGGQLDLVGWLRRRATADKFAFFIGRVDATGMTQESTLEPAPPPINISDRDHFRAQRDMTRDDLFISKPVLGRATRLPAMQFTRKLTNPDGTFAGIIQLSLSVDELSRFYSKIEIGNGYIELAGVDGVIRARGPLDVSRIGTSIRNPALLAAIQSQPQGTVSTGSSDKTGDIVSFRRLQNYPLIVLVGFDKGDIYRKYKNMRDSSLEIGMITTAALLLSGMFWIDQRRRGVRAKRALHVTLESISQGIVMLDAESQIPVINGRARQLLHLPRDLSDHNARGGFASALLMPPDYADQRGVVAPIEHVRDDGSIIEVQRNWIATGGMVLTYTDVTDRKLADARIRYLAQHDALTGLANRALLTERLNEAIHASAASGTGFAVLCLDLDGFKGINDSMGHDAGDALLNCFAERLRLAVRPIDTVARTGGDEFTIIQLGGIQPSDAERLAIRLRDTLAEPLSIDGLRVTLATSIGISAYPANGKESRTLLRNADTALYKAKEDGRGVYRVFEPWMDTFLQERRSMERDLKAALEQDLLEVYLQPQFHCETLQFTGFEALVRWDDPVRGCVPPSVFIPVAEECGLILPLGRRVLELACELAAGWDPQVRIAVNVSPVQFRDDSLPALIAEVLQRTGLPAHLLEVEVTEGVLIRDEQQALARLHSIKEQGVRVALDDFGTGYSSLSYLRRFPFDKIKIDKYFVQGQQHDTGTQAIIDAVFAMSSRLNLDVIAEGVETEEQLAILRLQRCTEVQGFLLGRPMPARDVPAFLRSASWASRIGQPPRIEAPAAAPPSELSRAEECPKLGSSN